MIISRRNFLTKVSVGVAGMSLMPGLGWSQSKGKLGYMRIVDCSPMFMAMEKGFFKAEGLELETAPMAGGAVIVQGVTSGDLQFGWTNVISLYQAHVEGFDFKFIAGGAINARGSNETHAIVVGVKSPIKVAKDLEGKTVAVNTLNNIVHLLAMAWIDKYGGNSSKVKFVEIPFPQMEPALVAGKVDAISVQEPFAAVAARRPETRVLSNPWGDVLPRFLIASWFASEKWLQKNRAVAQSFVRALNRGIDATVADKDGARAAMIKWAGLNPDFAGKIGIPLFEKNIPEKDLQVTIDLSYKYKMISKPIKARDVINELARKA